MRRIAILLVLFLISQAAAFSAGNQPTQENNKLNIWYSEGNGFWMSTAASEPAADAPGGFGTGSPAPTFSWTVVSQPALHFDMDLDTSVNTEIVLFIGSTSNQRAGVFDTTATLSYDGITIATGESSQDSFANGVYAEVTVSATTVVDKVPAGATMTLDVQVDGVFQGIFLRHGDEARQSRVELPVVGGQELLPPEPAVPLPPQWEDTAASNLALEYSYPSPSTQTWTYNWTNMNPTGNITFLADLDTGSVQLLVIDGFNDTLADVTLEASFGQNLTFEGFEGNWTVQMKFLDFQGNATLGIFPDLPAVVNPLTGMEQEPGDGETFEDGNAPAETKDSPGVPFLLALLGLAFVALRRRG